MFADVSQKAFLSLVGTRKTEIFAPNLARTWRCRFHIEEYSELVPKRVFTR